MPRPWNPRWLGKESFTGSQDAMYVAVRDDNIVELQRLLATGPALHLVKTDFSRDPATAGGWGFPLHFAAYVGNLDAVRMFLDAGADPSMRWLISLRDGYVATPLYLAIEGGHRAIVKALWAAGGARESLIPETAPEFNYPQLAAATGQAAIVRDLFSWKQWDHEVKLSALKAAARCWRFHVVDELLRPGRYFENDNLLPDLDEALHDAVSFRQPYPEELHPEITPLQYIEQQMLIDRLIDAGANPNCYLDACPPLLRVAYWAPDSLGAMRTLLDNGADVDLDDREGNTAFHILVTLEEWCSPAISLMLHHHANADLNNRDGVSAFQLAAQHAPDWSDFETIFQEYVGADRPVDTFSSDADETLLHFAALGGKRETMEMLISAHVHDINAKTKTGWTPLMYALLPKTNGKYQNLYGLRMIHAAVRAAKLLLAHGANPLTTSERGWTPLHVLSLHVDECPDGEAKALALELISLGCPINPPPALAIAGKWHAMSEHIRYPEDRWQKLPLLHWAALHGAVDVVKALIESGANVFEKDMYNHTAREVAEQSEFLRNHIHGAGLRDLGEVGKMMLEVLDEAQLRQ